VNSTATLWLFILVLLFGAVTFAAQGLHPFGRDVEFVSVALGYGPVLEDRVLTEAAAVALSRAAGGDAAVWR
jgi:hypothetical protein